MTATPCTTCKFARRCPDTLYCHRYAPRGRSAAVWPMVPADDVPRGCGEHKLAESGTQGMQPAPEPEGEPVRRQDGTAFRCPNCSGTAFEYGDYYPETGMLYVCINRTGSGCTWTGPKSECFVRVVDDG